MKPALTPAENKFVKGHKFSANYKRVLAVRIRARLRCASALLVDPRLDFYINGSDIDMLARHFARHRIFREIFFSTLQSFADTLPP